MATLRKRGKYWHLDWYEDGVRKRKSLGDVDKKEAKAQLEFKKAELSPFNRGLKSETALKQIDFISYSKKYLNWFEVQYPSTYETDLGIFINDLEPFFDKTPLHKIDNEMVDQLIILLHERKNKPTTINRKISVLKAMLNKAKKDKYKVPYLSVSKVPSFESKPHPFFSLDELELLYKNSPSHWHWFMLLANTGMRLGELRNLRVVDVKDKIYVISTNQRRTKSKKWRLIPINQNSQKALKQFDLSGEYVFPQSFNKQYPTTALTRACQKVGIDKSKWGVHTLRHTFASHLVMSGKPLKTVQELMGHASIKTTEIYAHLAPDYLEGSLDNFNL